MILHTIYIYIHLSHAFFKLGSNLVALGAGRRACSSSGRHATPGTGVMLLCWDVRDKPCENLYNKNSGMCLFLWLMRVPEKNKKHIYIPEFIITVFFVYVRAFFNGSRITSSQNGCLFFPHPCFRMTWLGGTLPYLILYGSQNDVKIKAQASPTLAWTCTVATWFLLVFWLWCPSSNHQSGIVDNVWSFSFNQNDILDVLNDMIHREGRMIWEVIRKRSNGVGATQLQEFATMCYRDLRHALLVMIDLILALSGLPGAVTLEDVEVSDTWGMSSCELAPGKTPIIQENKRCWW